jgi:hypothetical protein
VEDRAADAELRYRGELIMNISRRDFIASPAAAAAKATAPPSLPPDRFVSLTRFVGAFGAATGAIVGALLMELAELSSGSGTLPQRLICSLIPALIIGGIPGALVGAVAGVIGGGFLEVVEARSTRILKEAGRRASRGTSEITPARAPDGRGDEPSPSRLLPNECGEAT